MAANPYTAIGPVVVSQTVSASFLDADTASLAAADLNSGKLLPEALEWDARQ